jgi:signal transduction histidine kinase
MVSLTRRAAGSFSPEDATLASAFAAQAAIALENAGLYDEITRFNEQLEQMVKQRTEELNQANQALEQMDRAKTKFIEIAAHELRTPLTLVKGYAQLMESMVAQNPDLKQLLAGILAGQSRLHEIINSMLDVTRLSNQTLSLRREPTRIAEVIRPVLNEFKPALQERRLTLTTQGLEDLPTFRGDPELLLKVLYHVIVNAIKYTPDGGVITVIGQHNADWIEVVVSDTGIGIDPAYHELIFEKFYQIGEVAFHSSGKTKFKGGGPGLGLSIAKGIVDAHGGRIWVDSPGHNEQTFPGSQFHIKLPINPS